MRQDPLTTQLHKALSDELQSYFRPALANCRVISGHLRHDQMPVERMQQLELDLQISDAANVQRANAGFYLA